MGGKLDGVESDKLKNWIEAKFVNKFCHILKRKNARYNLLDHIEFAY